VKPDPANLGWIVVSTVGLLLGWPQVASAYHQLLPTPILTYPVDGAAGIPTGAQITVVWTQSPPFGPSQVVLLDDAGATVAVERVIGPQFSVGYWTSEAHRLRPREALRPRSQYRVSASLGSIAQDVGSFWTGDGPGPTEPPAVPSVRAEVGPPMNCAHPALPLTSCLFDSNSETTLFSIELRALTSSPLYTVRAGATLVAEGLSAPLWGVVAVPRLQRAGGATST
jgi:hypothetical protein